MSGGMLPPDTSAPETPEADPTRRAPSHGACPQLVETRPVPRARGHSGVPDRRCTCSALGDHARRHPRPAHPEGRARERRRRGDASTSCATPTTGAGCWPATTSITLDQAAALRPKATSRPSTHRQRQPSGRRRARRHLDQPRARTRSSRSGAPPTPSRRCPAGSARSPSATTARSSSAQPRAGSGPTTPPPAPGPRAPRTPTPSRSARWRSRRATTRSSTWAPARAPCPATATTATASTSPPTAGVTWKHVSTLFTGQAVSAIAVDPTNPHARVRRDGPRPWRQPPHHRPDRAPYGVWESTDGGATLDAAQGHHDELHGATDLVMDPQNPKNLWASFWGDGDLQVHRRRRDLDQRAGQPARRQLPRGRHPVLARHLPPGGQAAPDALHRLRLLRPQRRLPRRPASSRASTAARHWTDATGAPAAGTNSVVGLLRHAVLLRQRRQARPDQPGHRLRRSAPTATTSARSPAASTAPPTAARPGRTSATTCTPTSTPSRSSPTTPSTSPSATTAASGSRTPAAAATAPARPAVARRDWENLNGTGRPEHRGASSTPPAWPSPSSPPWRPCRSVPGQYWGGTQDNGTLRKSLANNRWFDQAER